MPCKRQDQLNDYKIVAFLQDNCSSLEDVNKAVSEYCCAYVYPKSTDPVDDIVKALGYNPVTVKYPVGTICAPYDVAIVVCGNHVSCSGANIGGEAVLGCKPKVLPM